MIMVFTLVELLMFVCGLGKQEQLTKRFRTTKKP